MSNRIYLSPPMDHGNELKYLNEAYTSGWIAPLGPFVNRFENAISEHVGAPNIVALSSGTAAIQVALRIIGVNRGDKILCSSLTFIGSVSPIISMGATPVFIDSEKETWNICPILLERYLEKAQQNNAIPKALILVHIYGICAQFEQIATVCKKYGVEIVEDAAESLGSKIDGMHCGTSARFGIYSFNGNKIITTSGGGALVCQRKEDAVKAVYYATQAREDKPFYEHLEVGYNFRLSNLLAAVGLGQIECLDKIINKKRKIFELYQKFLDPDKVEFMPVPRGQSINYWLTCIVLKKTKPLTNLKVVARLNSDNIESRPIWKPMHLQPVFSQCESELNGVSEFLFTNGMCLPSGADLTAPQIKNISEIINSAF